MISDDTRERLLKTARALFAQRGYDGTSIRAITAQAHANLGAVTYHFGSKEALYHEVLRAVLFPLRNRVLAVCSRDEPVELQVEAVIRAVFEHLWDNPDQPRFMLGIRLDEGSFPPAIMEVMAPVMTALVGMISRGQAQGFVRPGNPFFLVLSLLSQPIYIMILTRRAPGEIFPIDPHTPEGREVYLGHMVDFAIRGLRAQEAIA